VRSEVLNIFLTVSCLGSVVCGLKAARPSQHARFSSLPCISSPHSRSQVLPNF